MSDDQIAVLFERWLALTATIEHLTRITELLAQRLGGTLSIHGLAGLDLTTSDALELLAQYPNRHRPTTAGAIRPSDGCLRVSPTVGDNHDQGNHKRMRRPISRVC